LVELLVVLMAATRAVLLVDVWAVASVVWTVALLADLTVVWRVDKKAAGMVVVLAVPTAVCLVVN